MKPKMTPWMSRIATALGDVDLTTCRNWKHGDSNDTVVATLPDELQALHRLREHARDIAETHLAAFEKLYEDHLADSHKNEDACRLYQESSDYIKKGLDQSAREYFNLTQLFMIEIQEEYAIDFAEILVVGVREGKILVTRQDNKLGDYSKIDIKLFGEECKLGYTKYNFLAAQNANAA